MAGTAESSNAPYVRRNRREADLIRRNLVPIKDTLEEVVNGFDSADVGKLEASNDELFNKMKKDMEQEEIRHWDNNNMSAFSATKSAKRKLDAVVETMKGRNKELRARVVGRILKLEMDNRLY